MKYNHQVDINFSGDTLIEYDDTIYVPFPVKKMILRNIIYSCNLEDPQPTDLDILFRLNSNNLPRGLTNEPQILGFFGFQSQTSKYEYIFENPQVINGSFHFFVSNLESSSVLSDSAFGKLCYTLEFYD